MIVLSDHKHQVDTRNKGIVCVAIFGYFLIVRDSQCVVPHLRFLAPRFGVYYFLLYINTFVSHTHVQSSHGNTCIS